MKMDFSKFKKMASDTRSTTLKHPEGHKIIIAHASLSPSMRKKLDEIPKKYADGGDVDEDKPSPWQSFKNDVSGAAGELGLNDTSVPTQDGRDFASQYNTAPNGASTASHFSAPTAADQTASAAKFGMPQSTVDAINQYPIPQGQQDVAGPTPASTGEPSEAPAPEESTQEMPPQASVQADAVPGSDQQAAAEDKQTAGSYQKGFHDYYKENAQKLGMEDAAYQHDLTNGHITPETYHDLFAKKDTLGKIGTIFGLLVSGAGAGLSHQPNALLGMMNNEIEKDFQAQTQSKNNAQNFLRIHQQQALNDAQVKQMGIQGTLTAAEAKKAGAEADVQSQAATLMKMNRTAFHNLALQVQKMPPGPQRTQAEQALAMTGQAIDAKNFNIADVAAGKAAFAKMLGDGSGGGNTTLLKTIPGMEGAASDIESKTVPGVGQAQIPVPQDIRDQLTAQKQYDEKAKEYVAFAKKHAQNWANLNPIQRQQIANQGAAMGANLQNLARNKNKGGVWKAGEQGFIEQTVPSQPAAWSASFDAIPKVEQTIRDNQNDLKNTASSVGIDYQPASSYEGRTASDGKGNKIIMKNGKWVPYGK